MTSKAPANPDGVARLTFSTSVFNVSSALVAIEAEAFRAGLTVERNKLGGLVEQTWGLTINGKKKELEEFQTWFEKEMPKICSATVVRDFFKNL